MDDLISREGYKKVIDVQLRFYDPDSSPWHVKILELQRELLDSMSAVDAVPVEWLEDKELDYRTIGDKMFSDAFAVVIGEWQKEQEAR